MIVAPVSPLSAPSASISEGAIASDHDGQGDVGEDAEVVNLKDAVMNEPIVGVERVIVDSNGPGALPPPFRCHPHVL